MNLLITKKNYKNYERIINYHVGSDVFCTVSGFESDVKYVQTEQKGYCIQCLQSHFIWIGNCRWCVCWLAVRYADDGLSEYFYAKESTFSTFHQ